MRERRLAALGLAAAAAALACQGHPISLSAQKGSTILIPLAGIGEEDLGTIGFGSAIYDDRQRGALVYRLDGPTGPELVTRVTTALAGPLASPHGFAAPFGLDTDLIVSMVDIPNTAAIPLGTHALQVTRRLGGVEYPGPPYTGLVQILPASIVAGSETVTGTPTPFQVLAPLADVSGLIDGVVPHPQVLFAPWATATRALELEVSFPSNLVAIRDVTEALIADPLSPVFSGVSESHRAHTWWKTLSAGRIAVGMLSPDRPIRGLSVVFSLKAAATGPVAASAFGLSNVRSWDADGDPVSVDWAEPWIR